MVKTIFKNLAEQGGFHLVNKKVIVPHYTEVMRNKAALKFKNFIRPGDEISIKITEASGKLRFEISNDKVCASGRICL